MLEFPGRERPAQALRASPTVVLTEGGTVAWLTVVCRNSFWKRESCRGLAGLGL